MAAFDSAYFRKYYFDAATRVTTAAEMRGRAQLIAAIVRHAGVPVRTILDAGCGMGLLRKPFAAALPRARYRGLEMSDYLCARYRWTKGSVVDFAPRSPSDLVVCYDVLQYLDDRDAARAISNLAALTRAALYVSALDRAGLARELRQGPHRPVRAFEKRGLVPAATEERNSTIWVLASGCART